MASQETAPAAGALRKVAGIVVAVVIVQAILVFIFAWPSSRATPHNLPLAVVGPPAAVAGFTQGVAAAQPGGFSFTTYQTSTAAQQAVTGRLAYGAVVFSQTGVTLYTASAASPSVAALLAQAIPHAITSRTPTTTVTVTDLAPNPVHDPHGVVPTTGLIPLVITSIVIGVIFTLLIKDARIRIVGVVVFAVLAGLGATTVMQSILGGLNGSWFGNAAFIALLVLAVTAPTAGLGAVLGLPGIGVAAAIIFFFGYPFSGATSAPELLPTPWGAIGQFVPPGAGSVGLRAVAFFNGARVAMPLTVLAVWALVGLVLLAVGLRRKPQGSQATA